MFTQLTPAEAVDRCQEVLAHAWMVRTFVKHSTEVEDFPELMGIVREVFDASRALETRVGDPPAYLHMLRKKISKLRQAAAKFRADAPHASTHTNFQQAVISMDVCVRDLEEILKVVQAVPHAVPGAVSSPEAVADDVRNGDEGDTGSRSDPGESQG